MAKPSSNIPGMDAMTGTFDFFKNMWNGLPGMNVPHFPAMVMPTLSVEEIDKQIKDLKSVESWLSLNLNMLQGTIQALEMQKTTISTLQTMGQSFTNAMQSTASHSSEAKSAGDKPNFESPFGKSRAAKAADTSSAQQKTADGAAGEEQNAIPPMANPAMWWNMLQDQFKQAVDSAAAISTDDKAVAPKEEKSKPAGEAAPRKRKPGTK